MVRSTRPLDVAATFFGTYYFLFFANLDQGAQLIPHPFPALIQVLSIVLQVYAKYTLGRSFGLLPANRGVVQKGPYRVVRHPIYLSYFIGHIGFLLGFFSWYNLLVIALLYVCQAARMLMEEKVLSTDIAYINYVEKVRWRFIPGIF